MRWGMLTLATVVASATSRSSAITVGLSSVVIVHIVFEAAATSVLSREVAISEFVVRGTPIDDRSRLLAPFASVDGSHV
jgi:hypothetical protein